MMLPASSPPKGEVTVEAVVDAVDPPEPNAFANWVSSPDNPEPDDAVDAAGDARLCSVVGTSWDSVPCAVPAETPAAWATEALCRPGPAGLAGDGGEVNVVNLVAAAELPA